MYACIQVGCLGIYMWKTHRAQCGNTCINIPEQFPSQGSDSSSAPSAMHGGHGIPAAVLQSKALHCAEYGQTVVPACSGR